jgi:hypothetical protein
MVGQRPMRSGLACSRPIWLRILAIWYDLPARLDAGGAGHIDTNEHGVYPRRCLHAAASATLDLRPSAPRGRMFLGPGQSRHLAQVSWIDPNFQEPTGYTHPSNDDHPPSDIRHGQELVLMIYRALISNQRAWERTLFVITYDEHGGLYDHVPPPMRPQDKAPFNRLGVRVPALIRPSPSPLRPSMGARSARSLCGGGRRVLLQAMGRSPTEVGRPFAGRTYMG